jgi:F0F1-type ATP synthase membrane subunit b/b'
MNELELINSQLNDINNKCIKYQTLIEQAKKQCEEIEQKYNVSSLDELKTLVDKADSDYQQEIQNAQQYITQANEILATYNGVV